MLASYPVARLALLSASITASACSKIESDLAPPPDAPFQLAIAVNSDPGRPLAGAKIGFKSKTIATSDDTGTAKVEIGGTEGEAISLAIQCPDGYASPDKPLVVGLRHLAPGSPPPKFEARCTPLERTVVVALRADNGPNLPVLQLGREVARTDATGVAHFVMHVKPAEPVTLTLGTDEKPAEALRPQNPTLQFVAKDQDDYVLLEQKFTTEKKKSVVKKAPKPMPL
jgi:hypothetical protein